LKRAKIAIIGGTGFEELFADARQKTLETPYGTPSPIFAGKMGTREVFFLPRHGEEHSLPPHRINYRANIYALHKLGTEVVLSTNAVGAIDRKIKPGDTVVPHDFVDFTKLRPTTFYDDAPVTHVDVSQPFCPEAREMLVRAAKRNGLSVWARAVLACTEGPRFETPAEIEMFRRMGCDIVGMTVFPEVALAREMEMCYATICYVSNMAAGMQQRLTTNDVSRISKRIRPKLEKTLIETIRDFTSERRGSCACSTALKNARFR
jgi:5'-methylthioadenosine phosphorylase